MVHSLCVNILYFPVRLSHYGAFVMCQYFMLYCLVVLLRCTRYVSSFYIFLLGCLSMVHSFCVNIFYFPVSLSIYGALLMCHHFIFSC